MKRTQCVLSVILFTIGVTIVTLGCASNPWPAPNVDYGISKLKAPDATPNSNHDVTANVGWFTGQEKDSLLLKRLISKLDTVTKSPCGRLCFEIAIIMQKAGRGQVTDVYQTNSRQRQSSKAQLVSLLEQEHDRIPLWLGNEIQAHLRNQFLIPKRNEVQAALFETARRRTLAEPQTGFPPFGPGPASSVPKNVRSFLAKMKTLSHQLKGLTHPTEISDTHVQKILASMSQSMNRLESELGKTGENLWVYSAEISKHLSRFPSSDIKTNWAVAALMEAYAYVRSATNDQLCEINTYAAYYNLPSSGDCLDERPAVFVGVETSSSSTTE